MKRHVLPIAVVILLVLILCVGAVLLSQQSAQTAHLRSEPLTGAAAPSTLRSTAAAAPAIRPLLVTPDAAPTALAAAGFHTATEWSVQPSLAYDALNFFNALTGDPFYLAFYQDEYDRFHSQATPEVETAIATLDAARQQYQFIIGAALATIFAPGDPETIDDLLALAAAPQPLYEALLRSGLGSRAEIDAKWPLFESLLPSITTVLDFLQAAGFEEYWRANVLPGEEALAKKLRAQLAVYNVVPAVETLTGRSLPSQRVEIFLSYFNSPYGARVPGTRFIMETRVIDPEAFARATIHELLHQPYDVNNAEFWAAVDTLKHDPFVVQRFETHDINRGYNDWAGYIGESCTDVAEQFISEQLGIARPIRERFGRNEDGGMHVLGPALYVLARDEGFPQSGETFEAFVIRMVQERKLTPGKLEALMQEFRKLQSRQLPGD